MSAQVDLEANDALGALDKQAPVDFVVNRPLTLAKGRCNSVL